MLSVKQYKFAKRNKLPEIAKLTTINEHEGKYYDYSRTFQSLRIITADALLMRPLAVAAITATTNLQKSWKCQKLDMIPNINGNTTGGHYVASNR